MADDPPNQKPPEQPDDLPPDADDASGLEQARELAEAEEGHYRHPAGWTRYIVPTVAVAWSLFQLATAKWWLLDAIVIRCVHLAFALFIVFLEVPFFKKLRIGPSFLYNRQRIPIIDYLLAGVAAFAALYYALFYEQISGRQAMPNRTDIVVGILLLVVLLEGARRVIGPALSVVAILFISYAFLGEQMPDFLAFQTKSLARFINQMSLTDAGIYGIPLDVSAKIVFLFVLFGAMLEQAGGGRFFIQLAMSLLGTFRGGPAKAAILASGLTGMISGSSIANIVTTGTFTIPLMKKVGYPAKKAAAIEVAASTDGQLAPPIMGAAAFIIAETLNIPYVDVIKAAAIPAFASYAALFYITHLEACKLGLKGIPRRELPAFGKVLAAGWHFLIPLGVLLYHLIIKRHSPDLAAFHAVWVMGLIMLIQKPLKAWRSGESQASAWKASSTDILLSLASGARAMVPVALATAAAGIIVGVVALGPGAKVVEIIAHLSQDNIYLMLLITALISLFIGMGLPTTATYIVVATLVAPAIVKIGEANGFHVPPLAAHLFCFYFGILADDTPPVGLAAYAASAIAKSPPIPTGIQAFTYDVRTAILPFMFVFNAELILHGVDHWGTALLVFVMACLGNLAFASATQGWLAARNRWFHLPFLLAATLFCFRPDLFGQWFNLEGAHVYWSYLLGAALFAGVYLLQKLTTPNPKPLNA